MDWIIFSFNVDVEQSNKTKIVWEFDFAMALQTVPNVKSMCHSYSCQIRSRWVHDSTHLFLCACVRGVQKQQD